MDANDVIPIIKRRQAKFQAQHRSGPQEDMDEAARLIVEEYDVLLAEVEEVDVSSRPRQSVRIKKLRPKYLGSRATRRPKPKAERREMSTPCGR